MMAAIAAHTRASSHSLAQCFAFVSSAFFLSALLLPEFANEPFFFFNVKTVIN